MLFFQGYFAVINFNIDDDKFPPYIPAGRYKLQPSILFDRYIMTRVSAYIEIVYKVKQ